MTTVFLAARPDDVRRLLPWARCFAIARGDQLTILLLQKQKHPAQVSAVDLSSPPETDELHTAVLAALAHSETSDNSAGSTPPATEGPTSPDDNSEGQDESPVAAPVNRHNVQVFRLAGMDWTAALPDQLRKWKPDCIVVPAPDLSRNAGEATWQQQILSDVDCEVILMRDDGITFERSVRIAAFCSYGADNETTLQIAREFTEAWGGSTTAVFIEPPVTDLAEVVGRHELEKLLRRTVGHEQAQNIERRVFVFHQPVEAYGPLPMEEFDLVLFATNSQRQMQRFLRSSPVSEDAERIPAVAVIRPGVSAGGRVLNAIDRRIRAIVPQLSREERIDLVGRIQSSSVWDFDFILLISMATIIACLGLAENSGAVIVGAMLVAPLMSPIAGAGLGVAHANPLLTRVALRTALRGFAMALLIGLIFGFAIRGAAMLQWLEPLFQDGSFPAEMEKRLQPQFYDMLIALASAVAAAYAMGRPELSSALPGVAIAAALVPPIATSGMAVAWGRYSAGTGALLLFLTNMVVIILGASLTFRAVGVRAQKDGSDTARWPRYVLLLLVLLSILVTVVIEVRRRG